jgi:RNA polymerase sigma factor (sigma-70 family)
MRTPLAEARPQDGADRFERLFRRQHAAVVAYVRRRAPADLVDDVVSETFLVTWRRLEHVPEEELPWLLAVARNVLATQRRGARRRRGLTAKLHGTSAAPAMVPALESCSGDADGVDRELLAALAKLSARDREALLLIAWDELESHQAAVVLGERPGAFRVRLHRARKRLRRLLEDSSELAGPPFEHTPSTGETHE